MLALAVTDRDDDRALGNVGATPEGIRERSHRAEGREWDMTIWSLTR